MDNQTTDPTPKPYEPPAYVRAAHEGKPSWVMTSAQRWIYAAAGAVGIAVILTMCIAAGIASASNSSQSSASANLASGNTSIASGPTSTPAPTDTPQPTATPAPTDTATPLPQPQVVLDFTGSGIKTSKTFDVSGQSQTLDWKCDHSSFDGMDYNVQVYLYDDSTHQLVDSDSVPVNAMCQSNYTSDSTEMYLDPGTYYIEVNSEGYWHITIKDNP